MTIDDDLDDVDPFDDAPGDGGSIDGDEPEQSPVAGPADPLFGGVDVAALAGELIGPAVRKAVGKKLDAVAAEAVKDALTPDVLAQLRADADEAAQALVHGASESTAGSPEASAEPAAPPLYYGSTNEFVREYLRHVYKRKINGTNTFWSPQWWRSDEAIARLEALWLAWEHLRLDGTTGPSVWWRDHADPHMSVLMSSSGPFAKETDVSSSVLEPLPHEEPPEALFPDVRVGTT